MKVTTFIRAYKIILSDIEKKVRDWERVFIIDVSFDSNKLQIVFADNKDMVPGTIAMRTALEYGLVDRLKLGTSKLPIISAYADAIDEVNDVGKFMSVLDFTLSQLKTMVNDIEKDAHLLGIYFDTVNNFAVMDLSLTDEFETFKLTLRTDGKLTMFSEYNEDDYS